MIVTACIGQYHFLSLKCIYFCQEEKERQRRKSNNSREQTTCVHIYIRQTKIRQVRQRGKNSKLVNNKQETKLAGWNNIHGADIL